VSAPAAADARAAHSCPSIKRRLICLVYEALLAFGIATFASLIFLGAAGANPVGWMRHVFQGYLFVVIGLYFVASWLRRGQTLAMKTWKLLVVGADGKRITPSQAMLRYACAWPCLALGGVGLLYAWLDRDRQFLHDRLAGTKIVRAQN
jgi:uncharacterized RDD family membrane protein YckC